MILNLALYLQDVTDLEYKRIDLFDDETISITQVIQDVKDIQKIFTEFTKTFTIPANTTNNRLFKHYYNYDIDNGFDGRVKINGYIEINTIRFNTGKVKLEGVDMRNNQPYAYRITYYGDVISLNDLIGEDKLNALDLSAYDTTYNSETVKTKLQANPSTNDVIAPFISHTNRYFYDSTIGHTDIEVTNNLHYDTGIGHNHGLLWSDLKYALRVHSIIQAIEAKYGLTFSDDFFNSSNAQYYNLFMWLHRQKGNVQGVDTGINPPELLNYFVPENYTSTSYISESVLTITEYFYDNLFITFNTSSTDEWKFFVYKDGVLYFESLLNVGSLNTNLDFPPPGNYTIYIQSQTTISFNDVVIELAYTEYDDFGFPITIYDEYTTTSFNTGGSFIFNMSQQIPEIKTIDFLTGLFKMFNLTAYIDNGVIIVKSLNDFYNTFDIYDISKYIQMDSRTIDVALPYRKIEFGYEDTKTLLALKHNQEFNYEWGKENYEQAAEIEGEIYSIIIPFSHMKYERINDVNGNAQTNIQWGYSATDNYNAATGNYDSYIGKPLLFYPILVSGTSLSFRDTDSTHSEITSYIAPSNSLSFNSTTSAKNINFKLEANEWTGDTSFTDTLFVTQYQDYILQIFNPKNRLTKLKAILPLNILLNYKLNDRFKINDRLFKINKITTNLTNGESDIELLNDL